MAEHRSLTERPALASHLEQFGLTPDTTILGYRITYRELDNIAEMAKQEGWSGLIGLDRAVQAMVGSRRTRQRDRNSRGFRPMRDGIDYDSSEQ
jgi:hypothetical protein